MTRSAATRRDAIRSPTYPSRVATRLDSMSVTPDDALIAPQLVIWGYAWAAAKDDRAFPPSSTSDGNIKTAASLLLESIMSQSSRPDHLDTGVGDLLASVAERLQGGEEIEREDAGLLWRLCGQGKGRR